MRPRPHCTRWPCRRPLAVRLTFATAHVIANATHPEHRRRGLAPVLLTVGEGLARRFGARWFLGEVRRSNESQLRVLDGLAWQRVAVSARFFANGEDAHVVFRGFPAAATTEPQG